MRKVKTYIYMSVIGDSMRKMQKDQVAQKRDSSKELMTELQEQQTELVEAETRNNELVALPQTKETKAEVKDLGKRITALKKSIATLAQQIHDLHEDIDMINGGMIYVGTGKFCKKSGAEKFKPCQVWDVMPDQAVYNSTWADEQSKKQAQDILCGMSVHAQLLEDFHKDVPSLGKRFSDHELKSILWSSACTSGDIHSPKAQVAIQSNSLTAEPPMLWSLLNKTFAELPVQRNTVQLPSKKQDDTNIDDVEDNEIISNCVSCYQNCALGVKCANGHFICTCCISMLIQVEMDDLNKLRKNLGNLRCPKVIDNCPPLGGEDLECSLRRVCTSVYDEYRNLQRRAYKMKEILAEATGTSGSLPDIPPYWTNVSQDKYSVHIVPLVAGCPEFLKILQMFRKTCKQESIVGIDRIQNYEQWSLYREKKRAMLEKNKADGVNERTLFHGTHPAAVALINQKSFNRSYCGRNATVYGRGVYFARDASYSASDRYSPPDDQGIQYMYVVSVLAGCTVEGDDDMLEPPPRPDGLGNYDTTCGLLRRDTLSDPSITVVYHDAQVCAEYLIRFRG
jgi:hypothetical protein